MNAEKLERAKELIYLALEKYSESRKMIEKIDRSLSEKDFKEEIKKAKLVEKEGDVFMKQANTLKKEAKNE